MSRRYKGAIISATAPTTSTTSASGEWTLPQQFQAQGAGTWPSPPSPYIEDWFSTYLYTGNSATNAISNGIDLSTKGGLVWIKNRSFATNHFLADTTRGIGGVSGSTYFLASNTTGGQSSDTNLMSANATGFTLLPNATSTTNGSYNYASWTFAKRSNFFDIVTYTGTGVNRTISHNLGSVPGCIIVKRTDAVADWQVYHGSLANTEYIVLNSSAAAATGATRWNSTSPTSTVFSVGTDTTVNASGGTYVAYLFASNAGGFGLTGSDNVISCGSFTTNASGVATVNLGYEPQWILLKKYNGGTQTWFVFDNMRGMPALVSPTNGTDATLVPSSTDTETNYSALGTTSTGFTTVSAGALDGSVGYIYIAIRRGPMKTPTVGTSVFSPIAANNATGTVNTTNFPVDLQIFVDRTSGGSRNWVDRLRGVITDTSTTATTPYLTSDTTNSEATNTGVTRYWNNTGFQTAANPASSAIIYWNFRRAPGFFDEICFTGTGAATSLVSHNLGTTPLLVIVKSRSVGGVGYNWPAITNTSVSSTATLLINNSTGDLGGNSSGMFTSTTVDFGSTTGLASLYANNQGGNASGTTYVAYLFASCPGVSKVGSYTGTAATQTIDCGFTTGARFVMIKRTDAANIWWVWDSARGITSGNDPYLAMNNNGTEITTTDYVNTTSVGFQLIGAVGPSAVGSYIFLAIA